MNFTFLKNLAAKFSNQKFASAKLNDSEMFIESEGEDFEVGSPVYIVENETPTLVESVMEFLLEDGRTIKTDETGLISEILPPAIEEEEEESEVEIEIEAEEVVVEETPTDVNAEKIAALELRISELETLLSALASMQEEFGAMKNKVERLYASPAEDKQKFSRQDENLTSAQRKLLNSIK